MALRSRIPALLYFSTGDLQSFQHRRSSELPPILCRSRTCRWQSRARAVPMGVPPMPWRQPMPRPLIALSYRFSRMISAVSWSVFRRPSVAANTAVCAKSMPLSTRAGSKDYSLTARHLNSTKKQHERSPPFPFRPRSKKSRFTTAPSRGN